MLIILLMVNPYQFGTTSIQGGIRPLLLVFFSTFFIPTIAVALMVALKMVPSMELKNTEDRIGPFIVTGVFYLSIFYFMYRAPDIPTSFKSCFLGAVMGLFIAFFLNLFSKISLHGVGMGGLLASVVIIINQADISHFTVHMGLFGVQQFSLFSLLIFTILVCGIVGSSRLFLGAHEPKDLYGGFLVGFSTQFIALGILT